MTIDQLTKNWESVSAEEAIAEVEREIAVRVRCFPRWIEEGRVSAIDARDRLSRLKKALQLIAIPVDKEKEEE